MTITEDNFRVCTMTKDQLKIVLENVSENAIVSLVICQ
jgi:hypothetical protein